MHETNTTRLEFVVDMHSDDYISMSEERKDRSSNADPTKEGAKAAASMAPAAAGSKGSEKSAEGKLEGADDRKRKTASVGELEEEKRDGPQQKKMKEDAASVNKEELEGKPEAEKPPERLNFPGKLMDLLQRDDKPDGIYWLPSGTIFAMNTTKMEDILIHHFQGAKFMSFTRTLNKW